MEEWQLCDYAYDAGGSGGNLEKVA